MEQFRQIGEVLGSIKAQLLLHEEIQMNPRQCHLLYDIMSLAFTIIAEEINRNLKIEERATKWKALDEPLKELHKVFREGEFYIRRCLDIKNWWGKAIVMHHNKDAIEFHIHNLLTIFPAVIESIESASVISGQDHEDMKRKQIMILKKYESSLNDPVLFEWRFGGKYLVSREMQRRFEGAVKEDRLLLREGITEKKPSNAKMADALLRKMNVKEQTKGDLLPSSILLGAEDYQMKRRLEEGIGGCKEIQWQGESFALRHFYDDIEPLTSEISSLLHLTHPNIVRYLFGFYDEAKKECLLVMELMSKDLQSHMRECSSPRRRALFPLPVVVDIMLQVARGMEYLHSKGILIGELSPRKVFIRPRKYAEGYFHVKVGGYALRSVKRKQSRNVSPVQTFIWYAPEVDGTSFTDKGDVYSFGMLCFLLLTGKLPFDDSHLHGEQMVKNVRAGERPLFPSLTPRYLASLTRRCWHADARMRPNFSSVCRILRYVKKFLAMNPSDGQPHFRPPQTDYCELEAAFWRRNSGAACSVSEPLSVFHIPFEMFAYKVLEKEKTAPAVKFNVGSEETSNENEKASVPDDLGMDLKSEYSPPDLKSEYSPVNEKADLRSVRSEPVEKTAMIVRTTSNTKLKKLSVKPKPNGSRTLPRSSSSPGPKMLGTKRLSITT